MKSFIEKKLKSLLYFIELNFKMRFGNKSAVDIYYDNLSQDCYDFFKDKMKSSSVFLKVDDIRNFAIYRAIENNAEDNKNLFLEFGVYTGGSINLFSKQLKNINETIYGFDTFEGMTEPQDIDIDMHARSKRRRRSSLGDVLGVGARVAPVGGGGEQ